MKAEHQTLIQRILWILIFFTSLFLSFLQRDYFQFGIYKDDASYILLAKSIINSDNYGSIPGLDRSVIPDFPFGFPLLLSPLLIFFPENLDLLKIISLFATFLNAAILYWGWRWLMPGTSAWWGLAVSGLYAVFPLMIRHTSMVMSEPIFTTFCLGTIILAEYTARQEPPRKIHYILLGVLLASCIFIRTIGIALLIGVLIYLFLKFKRGVLTSFIYIILGMFLISAVIILLTPIKVSNLIPARYIQNDLVRIITERVNNFLNPQTTPDQITPVVKNPDIGVEQRPSPWQFIFGGIVFHLQTDVRDIVLPVGGGALERNIADRIGLPDLPQILGLIVSAIILLGIILSFMRYGPNVFLIFATVYYGFLIFWVWIGQRLLYPIQPQFQFAFLFGIFSLLALTVSKFKNKKLSTNLPKILLVIFVSSMILLSIVKSYSIKNSRNNIGDMQLRTQWVRENAALDDVILSEEPTTDYLYLQRNIIEFPFHVKSELEFSEYLQTASVDYILVAPEINWQPVAYEPIYSEQLDAILPYINQLATENMITLVHEDVSNLIRVYQVNSIVGQ